MGKAGTGWSRPAGILLVAAAALILWFPMLFPVHVEGFSAGIEALGLHIVDGSLGGFDPLQPFNGEYFGLTKFGASLAAAGLVSAGLGSALAMRLIMWIGMLLLVLGSASLARRWSGASWPIVLLILILMPGVGESAFFYNDNVLAAGLGSAGLALLYAERRWVLGLSGLLLGLSVLTRTDMMLVCVAAPFILWHRFGLTRQAVLAALVAGGAAAFALLVPLAFFHATMLDVIAAGSAAVKLWVRSVGFHDQVRTLLYFIGPPVLLLVALGLVGLAGRRDWFVLGLVVGIPCLVFVVLFGSLWEIRQFLGLTPFVAAAAGAGARQIWESRDRLRLWLSALVVAAAIFGIAGPVTGPRSQDGPRAFTGRLHLLPLWRAWQNGVEEDFAVLDTEVRRAATEGTTIFFTTYWNEDRYLHLALLRQGFRPQGTFPPSSPCAPVAQSFTNGRARAVHVRLHQSFVPYWVEIASARLERFGLPCARAFPSARQVHVAALSQTETIFGKERVAQAGLSYGARTPGSALQNVSYGPIVAVEMGPGDEARIVRGYRELSAGAAARLAAGDRRPTVEDGIAATRSRVQFPR